MRKIVIKIFSVFILSLIIISCQDKKIKSQDNPQTTTEPKEYALDETDFDSIGLQFTAFKTDKKVAVPGTFDAIYAKANSGKTIAEVMEGASFTIDTKSVNTANPERDQKIKEHFFGNLSDPYITGTFKSFTDSGYEIVLKMNNIEKIYTINSPAAADSLSFNFSIDVIKDFSASKSLEGIAKACEILHEGKTWSEVELKGFVKL